MGTKPRKSLGRPEQDRIREVLAQARIDVGMSQRRLSLALGQVAQYVWTIENGERTIDLVEFIDLARAVGKDPVEMFKRVVG